MKECATIDPQVLFKILNADRLRFSGALLALQQGGNETFANEDRSCFALVHQYPYGPFAFFTDYDLEFFRAVLRHYPKLNMCIDLPPGTQLQAGRLRGLKPYPQPYEFFAYEGDAPTAPIDPHIRLLAQSELELLRPVVQYENELDMPGIQAFAWFEGDRIAGYLHCSPEYEDIWDVGFVFVAPEHRGRGIAAALYYVYLKTLREQGEIPQACGVTNPASAAAARKAGFQPCSIRYAFKFKRPKIGFA